ncbi:MAG: c-type cytochrome [Nitrospirae bacterium]|nr:c-type cytochrome [Nitrospirota bacterium]
MKNIMSMSLKGLIAAIVFFFFLLPVFLAAGQDRPLPAGKLGQTIALGREISLNTAKHPMSKQYVGNVLNCSSCHLKNGTDLKTLTYIGVATAYPAYSPREDAVITLADRIAYCFMRSMNGIEPPADSTLVTAIAAYITWLSEGAAIKMNPAAPLGPNAMKRININPQTVDIENGKKVYQAQCASCHGDDGQGVKAIQFPEASPGGCTPLWGVNSFNKGAGMYKLQTAASFIKSSMPYGAAVLSEKDAVDVAAYINSKDRPDFDIKKHDIKKHLPNPAPRAKVSN